MKELSLDAIWETLESALIGLENGQGPYNQLTLAARASIPLLLEHPPSEVVGMAARSSLPARALVSWLVYEATRLGEVEEDQIRALRDYWNGTHGAEQRLIN